MSWNDQSMTSSEREEVVERGGTLVGEDDAAFLDVTERTLRVGWQADTLRLVMRDYNDHLVTS